MGSSTEKQELSQDEERLGEFLFALADKSFHDAEELNAEIAELPDPLERRVRSFEMRLQKLTGLEARDRQDLLSQYTRAVEGAYVESMTGLPNRSFVHEHMSSLFDGIVRAVRKGKTAEALAVARSRAFISFDLDGLKVVNDLAGQKNGDDYIKLFGGVLQEVAGELKQEGVRVDAARDGGDEFSLTIDWPGHVLDLKTIDAIVHRVQERFSAQDVRGIISRENIISGLEKIKENTLTFDEKFTFRPSVSGGGTSFYDALRVHMGAIKTESGYRAALGSFAGFSRDLGGIMAKKVKARQRAAMHNGAPNEQALAKLFDQFRPISGEEDEHDAAREQLIREHEKTIERLEIIIETLEREVTTLKAELRKEKKDHANAIEDNENKDRMINEQALFIAQLQARIAELQSHQESYGKKERAVG